MTVPINKAIIKLFIDCPPKRNRASKTKNNVTEVFKDLASVWLIAAFVISSKGLPGIRRMFSRIRSNTMIVSLTEYPSMVNNAVINNASTSKIGKKCPRIEKTPITNNKS